MVVRRLQVAGESGELAFELCIVAQLWVLVSDEVVCFPGPATSHPIAVAAVPGIPTPSQMVRFLGHISSPKYVVSAGKTLVIQTLGLDNPNMGTKVSLEISGSYVFHAHLNPAASEGTSIVTIEPGIVANSGETVFAEPSTFGAGVWVYGYLSP